MKAVISSRSSAGFNIRSKSGSIGPSNTCSTINTFKFMYSIGPQHIDHGCLYFEVKISCYYYTTMIRQLHIVLIDIKPDYLTNHTSIARCFKITYEFKMSNLYFTTDEGTYLVIVFL